MTPKELFQLMRDNYDAMWQELSASGFDFENTEIKDADKELEDANAWDIIERIIDNV